MVYGECKPLGLPLYLIPDHYEQPGIAYAGNNMKKEETTELDQLVSLKSLTVSSCETMHQSVSARRLIMTRLWPT